MAEYVVVDKEQLEADLTTVADAIREKSGTSDKLSFPSGMASAAKAIESGGGSGDGDGEFVCIKMSDFGGSYYQPRVVDARALQHIIDNDATNGQSASASDFIAAYLFANNSKNPNGGLYARMEEAYLPDGLKNLSSTFMNCGMFTTVHGDLSNIVSLGNTFVNCVRLLEIPYMPKISYFGGNCFQNCTGLTEAKIYMKPSTMSTTVFNGCTNIKDIYVPWSEGKVSNAPWGATNATIHYNTTYDENHNPIV